MDGISVRQVLEVVADLDELGGANRSLVAWELFVDEERVVAAWEQMLADGLLRPAGHDPADDAQLWRLTAGGWAAHWEQGERS